MATLFYEKLNICNISVAIFVALIAYSFLFDTTSIKVEVDDEYFEKIKGVTISYDFGNEIRPINSGAFSLLSAHTVFVNARQYTGITLSPSRVNLLIQPPVDRQFNHLKIKLTMYKGTWFMSTKKCAEWVFEKSDSKPSYHSFYCSKPWWEL